MRSSYDGRGCRSLFALLSVSLLLCLLFFGGTRGVHAGRRSLPEVAKVLAEEEYGGGSDAPPSSPSTETPPAPPKLNKRDPTDCPINNSGKPECQSWENVPGVRPPNPPP